VSWDGRLYDCDFNQQLDMPMPAGGGGGGGAGGSGPRGLTVFDIASLDELTGRSLAVDNHCFG
jgi:hypothetical protein